MTLGLKKQKLATVARVIIRRQKEKSKQITLVDASIQDILNDIKAILRKKGVDPFATGYTTSITAFRQTGRERKDTKTIRFRGLSVEQTYNTILKASKRKLGKEKTLANHENITVLTDRNSQSSLFDL